MGQESPHKVNTPFPGHRFVLFRKCMEQPLWHVLAVAAVPSIRDHANLKSLCVTEKQCAGIQLFCRFQNRGGLLTLVLYPA